MSGATFGTIFSAVKLANINQHPSVSEWNFFPFGAARIVAIIETRACYLSSEKIERFYDDLVFSLERFSPESL